MQEEIEEHTHRQYNLHAVCSRPEAPFYVIQCSRMNRELLLLASCMRSGCLGTSGFMVRRGSIQSYPSEK
jgi:hypothetical protein